MEREKELLNIAARIRTLAQNGLVYSLSEYDTERYEELQTLGNRITALVSGHSLSDIQSCFHPEKDYVTPKVDIRAVVFNDRNEILLVQEKSDGCWSLPGGWADVGFSPKEIAVKEVKEESGLDVKAVRLLAVMDKKCHNHPPATHYAYKIFILCETEGGSFRPAFDISGQGFFKEDALPPLSEERVLESQVRLMFEYKNNPDKEAFTD